MHFLSPIQLNRSAQAGRYTQVIPEQIRCVWQIWPYHHDIIIPLQDKLYLAGAFSGDDQIQPGERKIIVKNIFNMLQNLVQNIVKNISKYYKKYFRILSPVAASMWVAQVPGYSY